MSIPKAVRILLLSGIFLSCVLSVRSQDQLKFDEEYLTFELSRHLFQVSGVYLFSAKDSIEYPILYPFPVDRVYGKAFGIFVKDVKTRKDIPYTMAKDSTYIRFGTIVSGSSQLLIGYSQVLESNCAKYILTTTQNWNKPLKIADYQLVVDSGIVITSFSMEPQKRIVQGGKTIYFWQKKDFMPLTDFEVQFK
jgi:hypothetical protein